MEELGTCTYCLRTGRKKNLTTVDFDGHNIHSYCPRCVGDVIKSYMGDPWMKDKRLEWVTDKYVKIV